MTSRLSGTTYEDKLRGWTHYSGEKKEEGIYDSSLENPTWTGPWG